MQYFIGNDTTFNFKYFPSSVMVALRVVSIRRFLLNGYQPRSVTASMLLNRRTKECAQAALTNRTILNGSIFRMVLLYTHIISDQDV